MRDPFRISRLATRHLTIERRRMRNKWTVLCLSVAALLLLRQPPLSAIVGAATPRAQATATAPVSAKVWDGHAAEFEEYLRTAEVDHFDTVPLGVTHPRRAFFKSGGLVASAAWKVLPPGRPSGRGCGRRAGSGQLPAAFRGYAQLARAGRPCRGNGPCDTHRPARAWPLISSAPSACPCARASAPAPASA